MNYFDFEAEDFASDESFQNWYFKRNQKDIDFWDLWVANNPLMQQKVTDAVFAMQSLTDHTEDLSRDLIQTSWDRFTNFLDEPESVSIPYQNKVITAGRNIKTTFALVASVLLMAIATTYFITKGNQEMVHQTGFGETISITLPDNSVVTLNCNSRLTYSKSFGKGNQDREVRLEGEAYFSVVHTEFNQRFLVTTPDLVQVAVLGTEFNVKQRRSGTKVVLNSGKISLNINDSTQNILMEPGELVTIPEHATSFTKEIVNTDLYTSWKCKLFVFEDTPLIDVILLLEENYGLQVEVTDTTLLAQIVSGSVPSDNIELLMEGLSESFGLTIQHVQNHVTIMKKVN